MKENPTFEGTLIDRLRDRDPDAVAELAEAFGPKIHQLALRYLKNHEDAEEVVQDVLMKVFTKIDAFRGDAALSSWIYRITFNAAMSRLRTAKFSRPLELAVEAVRGGGADDRPVPFEPADWSGLADDAVLRSQLRRRFSKAVRHLPTIYRRPVLLRDVRGLSTEEASEALRINIQTLKSRLHRGRLMLRQQLADFSGGRLSMHPAT